MKPFGTILWKNLMLFLLVALLCGCDVLHDDLSRCDLFLKFRYDYNLSYEDWFTRQVDEVQVFIFDKEGNYIQKLTESGPALAAPNYRMQIPYEMKEYMMVVWAGRTEEDYHVPELAIGDPIEKLILQYEPKNNLSAHKIAPLWHSGPHKMTFPEEEGTLQTVSLVRNTNDVNISISSTSGTLPVTNFDITLKGANGGYDHKNNFLEEIPEITYIPSGSDATQQSPTAQLYTMRLIEGSPTLLSVTEKSSGKKIQIGGNNEIDLTEWLLKEKPVGMNPQEYLDRRYIWDIALSYDAQTYMAVSIIINGWTYWFHNTDL